jgi:hypothetical protein
MSATPKRDKSEKIAWLFVIFFVFTFFSGCAYDMTAYGMSFASAIIAALAFAFIFMTYLSP